MLFDAYGNQVNPGKAIKGCNRNEDKELRVTIEVDGIVAKSNKKSPTHNDDKGLHHVSLTMVTEDEHQYTCQCPAGAWTLEPKDLNSLGGGADGEKKTLDLTVRVVWSTLVRARVWSVWMNMCAFRGFRNLRWHCPTS